MARPTRLSSGRFAALALICLLVGGLGGAVTYFFPVILGGLAQTGQPVVVAPSPSTSATARPQPVSGSPFTVLLLGSDDDSKFSSDHLLTQSMILVRVDPRARHVTMLSIPRDLWVPLSTGGYGKIDAAYSYGRASAAITTVERNFNVHVDEYAWIGLKGLIRLIDQVGGVDLVVSNPVLDDFYPDDIDSTSRFGYKRVAVLPGAQHLDGREALQYVRSRHNDVQGDFGRSQRQQQVLIALKTKAQTMNAANLPDIVSALQGEFKTSMDLTRVRQLIGMANAFDVSSVKQIVLLPPTYTNYAFIGDQSVVLPNWDTILPLVKQNFP